MFRNITNWVIVSEVKLILLKNISLKFKEMFSMCYDVILQNQHLLFLHKFAFRLIFYFASMSI